MVMPALLRSLRVESFSTHSFIDPDEQAILAADLPAFTTQTSPAGRGDGRRTSASSSTAPPSGSC